MATPAQTTSEHVSVQAPRRQVKSCLAGAVDRGYVNPSLTWLDLTSRDREQMRRVLDLFSERGTVDELGQGTLRDAFSDALFPGTSSIQTRLRYFMFIPWLYQRLEQRRTSGDAIAAEARAGELGLIGPLLASDDTDGVIGARARWSLTRLPSSVYWAGLVRWGVFMPARSQSWYHTHFAGLLRRRDHVARADDPGVVWIQQPTWHPRLPEPPTDFPGAASFAMTHYEAEFLRGRIQERCPGSLLAWLVRTGSATPAYSFWDDPDALQAPASIAATIELARRFSLHVEGGPLLYNLMLAERSHAEHGSHAERIDEYRDELAQWASKEAQESRFEPDELWSFMAKRGDRVPEPQRRFVEAWSHRVHNIGAAAVADDQDLRTLIEVREWQLKGKPRARLHNAGRLLDWSGRVGVGRMDFRWFRVRQLLIDLHAGLGRGS